MPILCLGLSHYTAALELRERLVYSPAALKAALARFGCGRDFRPAGIVELAILSTCNRLELYGVVPAAASAPPQAPDFAPLLDFLVETRGLPAFEFEAHLYRYAGSNAVEHLCRVAAGLDSLVLGEPQILGQVSEAHEAALAHSATGPVLSALFRAAIRAGKRARTETGISRNPASVSSVAVHLARLAVGGDLERCRVLVIGAGEMGELTVAALRARGVRNVAIANRTRARTAHLAQRWDGQVFTFEQLTEALAQADIVITSTSAPHTIIGPELVSKALGGRAARTLVLIDIAVPRDVDPAVRALAGVQLFDMDDLQARLDGAISERRSEVPLVETIVAEEVAACQEGLRALDVVPVITELRQRAEDIRQRELDRTLRHLPDLGPEVREHIQHLSRSLVNKLLHEPTVRLRSEATSGRAAHYVETVRYLFDIRARPDTASNQE